MIIAASAGPPLDEAALLAAPVWWRATHAGYEAPQPLLPHLEVASLGVGDVDADGVDELLVGTMVDGVGHVVVVESDGDRMSLVLEGAASAPRRVGVLWRAGEPLAWADVDGEVFTAMGPDFTAWRPLRRVSLYDRYLFDDVDGDGTSDVIAGRVVPYWPSSTVQLFAGPELGASDPTAVLAGAVEPVALRGDRLSFYGQWEDRWWVVEQTAPWSFPTARPVLDEALDFVGFADFDGDGDDDAIVKRPQRAWELRWNEDGRFGTPEALPHVGSPLDVDHDGDEDLIVPHDYNTCLVALVDGIVAPPEPRGCASVGPGPTFLLVFGLLPLWRRS